MTIPTALDRADWHLLFDAVQDRLRNAVAAPCPAAVRAAVYDCVDALRTLQAALPADTRASGRLNAFDGPHGHQPSALPAPPCGCSTPPTALGPADGCAPGC